MVEKVLMRTQINVITDKRDLMSRGRSEEAIYHDHKRQTCEQHYADMHIKNKRNIVLPCTRVLFE